MIHRARPFNFQPKAFAQCCCSLVQCPYVPLSGLWANFAVLSDVGWSLLLSIFCCDVALVTSVHWLQGSWSRTQTCSIVPWLQKGGCTDLGDDSFSKNTPAKAESHPSFACTTSATLKRRGPRLIFGSKKVQRNGFRGSFHEMDMALAHGFSQHHLQPQLAAVRVCTPPGRTAACSLP